MAKKLKLGIVGMSEGNGHPYSWSAIFNGYNQEVMRECPFSVIPEYLSDKHFPDDGLGHLARVTHIWTQERKISEHISEASRIPNVVDKLEDMIGEIDAVLLARDDAENHREMSKPFIEAGIPIFIDKPLALSVRDADEILNSQKFENQIFTCSSIRFAEELKLSEGDKRKIGKVIHIDAQIPKKWDTYAIHIIEPVINFVPDRGKLNSIFSIRNQGIHSTIVKWENLSAYFKVTGDLILPLKFKFYGENGIVQKDFSDSFNCFKKSLEKFVNLVLGNEDNLDKNETMEAIRIIENGRL